jgi:hypothetical protein
MLSWFDLSVGADSTDNNRMVRGGIILSIALLGVFVCAENRAEDVPARSPRADSYLARRVVHAFDFEERAKQ